LARRCPQKYCGGGLLTGSYGEEERERAAAVRVYADAADPLMHIERLGFSGTGCL